MTSVELSAHDKRILAAAIALTLGVVQGGSFSASLLAMLDEQARTAIAGGINLLAVSAEGRQLDKAYAPDADVFNANLERLRQIGESLAREQREQL